MIRFPKCDLEGVMVDSGSLNLTLLASLAVFRGRYPATRHSGHSAKGDWVLEHQILARQLSVDLWVE